MGRCMPASLNSPGHPHALAMLAESARCRELRASPSKRTSRSMDWSELARRSAEAGCDERSRLTTTGSASCAQGPCRSTGKRTCASPARRRTPCVESTSPRSPSPRRRRLASPSNIAGWSRWDVSAATSRSAVPEFPRCSNADGRRSRSGGWSTHASSCASTWRPSCSSTRRMEPASSPSPSTPRRVTLEAPSAAICSHRMA